MTREEKIAILQNRIAVMEGRGNKNIKCPGALKALKRELRNLIAN